MRAHVILTLLALLAVPTSSAVSDADVAPASLCGGEGIVRAVCDAYAQACDLLGLTCPDVQAPDRTTLVARSGSG